MIKKTNQKKSDPEEVYKRQPNPTQQKYSLWKK